MTKDKKHETIRILRVAFTDAQILEHGRNLAEEHNKMGQTNSDFDRVKSEFKSKLSASEARIVDLSNKVSTGYEMRDVRCLWAFDDPKAGKKTLRRLDTVDGLPGETVEVCDMTEAEKTPELALNLDGTPALANPVLPAGAGVDKDGTVKVPADGPATAGEQK